MGSACCTARQPLPHTHFSSTSHPISLSSPPHTPSRCLPTRWVLTCCPPFSSSQAQAQTHPTLCAPAQLGCMQCIDVQAHPCLATKLRVPLHMLDAHMRTHVHASMLKRAGTHARAETRVSPPHRAPPRRCLASCSLAWASACSSASWTCCVRILHLWRPPPPHPCPGGSLGCACMLVRALACEGGWVAGHAWRMCLCGGERF